MRFAVVDLRYALCLPAVGMALWVMRDVEATMPAIASLEDLKAPQKDLCYSMRVCLKRSDPQVKRSSNGVFLECNGH